MPYACSPAVSLQRHSEPIRWRSVRTDDHQSEPSGARLRMQMTCSSAASHPVAPNRPYDDVVLTRAAIGCVTAALCRRIRNIYSSARAYAQNNSLDRCCPIRCPRRTLPGSPRSNSGRTGDSRACRPVAGSTRSHPARRVDACDPRWKSRSRAFAGFRSFQ